MKFLRFCMVGLLVFVLDFIFFNSVLLIIENNYLARWVSFCFAICCSWLGNTYFTFQAGNRKIASLTAFSKLSTLPPFFVMSHFTGIFNLLVYSAAVYSGLSFHISFVMGVFTSLVLNFIFAKRILGDDPLQAKCIKETRSC